MNDWIAGAIFAGLAIVNLRLLSEIVSITFETASVAARTIAGLTLFWAALVLVSFALSFAEALAGFSLWFGVTSFLALMLVSFKCIVRRRYSDLRPDSYRSRALDSESASWVTTLDVALGSLAGYVIVYGLVQLPMDWDSLAYHLPLIDHWIQYGNLLNQDCAFWYVPGNNELLGFYLAAGFSGDFWVQLHNLIPLAILIGSVLDWMRELGLQKRTQFVLFTALFVTQPMIRQVISAENDLSVAALTMSGCLFGWRFVRWERKADLIFLGVSVGLLCGVKYYALGYAAVATSIPIAWMLCRRRWSSVIAAIIVSASMILVLGSFWYARNWWLAETPLFPKGVLGMPDLWAEMRPGFSQSHLLNSGRIEVWPLLGVAWLVHGGFLPLVFVLLSWAGGAYWALRWKLSWRLIQRSSRSAAVLWISIFSFGCFAVYLITPNVVESEHLTLNMLKLQYHPVRFGICGMLCSGLVLACGYDRWIAGRQGVFRLVKWCSLMAVFVQVALQTMAILNLRAVPTWLGIYFWWPYGREPMYVLLIVSIVLSTSFIFATRTLMQSSGGWEKWLVRSVLVSGFGLATAFLAGHWHERYDSHFDHALRSNAFSTARKLSSLDDRLCVFDYRYYPFLGSRREYSVCRPLWLNSREDFDKYLIDESATLVAVPTTPDVAHLRYQDCRNWLDQDMNGYLLLHEDRRLVLARLKAAPSVKAKKTLQNDGK